MNEHWKEHFEHDGAFHRKTAAIYHHVNTEPRLLANDLLFARLDRRVARGAAMLDLGCGTGQMLLRYGPRFERCVGVDHSADMLAIARTRLEAAASGQCELVESEFFEFLERDREARSLVTCVGCLHHLPVDAFDHFYRLVRDRLAPDGQLLLAEPVSTGGRMPPPAVASWNARSVMASRAALMPMEESHEAPISDDVLLRRPEGFGYRRVAASRAWEMFQRGLPATVLDHLAMRYLHARHGRTGNVVAVLWQAT